MIDVESLRELVLIHPGVTEGMKWGEHLCFMVGEKMFLILGLDEIPVTASFKVRDEDFDRFSTKYGFKPAPYMARNKWVWTEDISHLTAKEWQEVIAVSYGLVKAKLTKKLQRLIDELED